MSACNVSRFLVLAFVSAFATACNDASNTGTPINGSAPAAKVASVTPTGRVIIIEMITDEKGNYYKPAKVEAHRGDILRFVLKTGVHNVNFHPDSNASKAGLPKPSDFLQLPGQEWEYIVSLDEGHYVFQCDPHAALGMIGRLEVEDDD